MSKLKRFSWPACLAIQMAPETPPAGPLMSKLTGVALAASAEARPPSERRIWSCTPLMRRSSSANRLSM